MLYQASLCLWGTMLSTAFLKHCASALLSWGTLLSGTELFTVPLCNCTLHCLSGALLCSAPLELFSTLPSWTVFSTAPLRHCTAHCFPALYPAPWALALTAIFETLCSALSLLGTVLFCTAPLRYFALHCPHPGTPGSVLPLWGTVLCTAILGHCALHYPWWALHYACPPCALHSALPPWSTVLCTATPWGVVLYTAPWKMVLCTNTMCHCALHCPFFGHCIYALLLLGAAFYPALMGHCALPTPPGHCTLYCHLVVLCSTLPLSGTVVRPAQFRRCVLHYPSRVLLCTAPFFEETRTIFTACSDQ